MTLLYRKFGCGPLCAVAALAGCATTPEAIPEWHAPAAPTSTVETFVAAWNDGETAVVLSTFEPTRRATIAAAPEFEARLASWKAVGQVVPDQCNPRGAFWKTAVVTFQDRRSGASIEEILWMHLHDGGWWMYSL